jgi:DNA gyrase/topoisomerase IV subunit A
MDEGAFGRGFCKGEVILIHPDDVAAWIAQVRQNPDAAPGIIEALAARLLELDEQNEALRDELLLMRRNLETNTAEGRVDALTRRVQTLERQLTAGAQAGPGKTVRSLLVFTLDGRGACLVLPDAEVWRGRDDMTLVADHLRPRHLLVTGDGAELLMLSDKGRAIQLPVAGLTPSDVPAHYLSLIPGLTLDLDESISAIIPLAATYDRLTLVTRKGYARSFRRTEVDSLLERRLSLHSSPLAEDYPACAMLSDGKSELLIVTRLGKGVRLPEGVVGVQSRLVVKLERGDVVAGAAVVDEGTTVALVAADGVVARREMGGFAVQSMVGSRGRIVARFGNLIGVAPVVPEDVLWLLTDTGRLYAIPAEKVPCGPGASGGKPMLKLKEDRVVALGVGKGA